MILSPAFSSPSWRSMTFLRLCLSIRTSLYSTSAILQSPTPLKMDARNIYAREWKKKNRESIRKWNSRWMQENRERRRELDRTRYERNPVHENFSTWLRNHDWPCQHLTWKTHIPIKTEDKVKRICSTCGRHGSRGLRLWWKRRSLELGPTTPAAYDCFDCFRKSNPEHVVPTEYAGLSFEDAYSAMKKARQEHAKHGTRTTAPLSAADEQHVRLSDKEAAFDTAKATASGRPS